MFDVLIISPAFAPCTLVGAARMTSLADYLQRNGYGVTVLSAGRWYYKNDLWTRKIPDNIKLIQLAETPNYRKALKHEALKLMESRGYSICITSMGPYDTQMFLRTQCRKMGVPLILDYRDPWLFNTYYYSGRSIRFKIKKLLSDCFHLPYERASIRYASKVITVTGKNADTLKRRYKKYSKKIETILNGHEELSEYMKDKIQSHSVYSIGCIGKFVYYNENAAIELLRSIQELYDEGIRIKIIHAGETSDNAMDLLTRIQVNSNLYEYAGKLNYDDAMRLLWRMDAALIVYGSKEGIGTKVFDYIGLNKPIIYAGILPSELGDFVNRFQNVVVADNVEDLKRGIRDLAQGAVKQLEENIQNEYSRNQQNRKYEHLIKEIIGMGD